jgi:putative peptide zinc metalloprotease protein
VWACVALFVVYGLIVAGRWDEFWSGVVNLYTLEGFSAWDWVILYTVTVMIGVIHELGHGLTTKYFGGEVHEIGGMLIYFSPALFCNTNDAWLFERRIHRLWVTFAGPWIQLVLAALAGIVWILTEPGTFTHRVAFLAVLGGGSSVLLANLNPLIPLDGYYALSDWLEIPNLRRRSFDYWTWLGKRFVLGIDMAEPGVTPRERRAFLIYGGLALLYTAFVLVASGLWFVLVLGRILGPLIWVIAAILTVRTIARVKGRSQALAVAAATTWRSGFLSGWNGWIVVVGAVLLVALPFVVPWTLRAHGQFRVEARSRAWLRAQVPGVLDRLYVHEGDTVRAGAPIAALWNPDLEARRLALQAQAERLRLNRGAAEARGDLAAAATAAAALVRVEEQLSVSDAALHDLVLRAPIDGIVLGHRLRERLGESMDRGDLLLQVASFDGRIARVRIAPSEAGDVAPGQWANLKLSARPDLKFRARVLRVAPAAERGWLEAVIPVPEGAWEPAPGMVGTAKIATVRMTIARAVIRAAHGALRLDLWL